MSEVDARRAPHVLMLTSNLLGSSRVSGVVRGHELVFQAARRVEQVAEHCLDELRVVLVDLDLPIDLEQLMSELPKDRAVRLIAYGPHVDTEKLRAAAACGWQVLTRGQFDATLPQLAAAWAAGET